MNSTYLFVSHLKPSTFYSGCLHFLGTKQLYNHLNFLHPCLGVVRLHKHRGVSQNSAPLQSDTICMLIVFAKNQPFKSTHLLFLVGFPLILRYTSSCPIPPPCFSPPQTPKKHFRKPPRMFTFFPQTEIVKREFFQVIQKLSTKILLMVQKSQGQPPGTWDVNKTM